MKAKYAIVCGSRTGSTHLCDLLASTKRCGNPREFFNPDCKIDYNEERSYLDSLIFHTKTENDVFGVKVVGMTGQWEEFRDSGLQISHWIRLSRTCRLDQAISRYIAHETGHWHWKGKPAPDVEYNQAGIQWCLDEIGREEEFFVTFLSDKNVLEIDYETDLYNPEQTVNCVLDFMDISVEEVPALKSDQKKRGRDRSDWKERFNSN